MNKSRKYFSSYFFLLTLCLCSYVKALACVEDSRGKQFKLSVRIKTIASGNLLADEILLHLLLKAGQLDRLAAVSYLADDPHYSLVSEAVKPIRARVGLNIESLISLKPDLVVLASFNRPELIHQLEQLQIPCYVMDGFSSFDDIERHLVALASLLNLRELGLSEAKRFRDALQLREPQKAQVGKEVKPRVLLWQQDGSTQAKASFGDELISLAGALNVAAELGLSGFPQISQESLMKEELDLIIAVGPKNGLAEILTNLRAHPALSRSKAVKNNAILLLSHAEINSFFLGSASNLRKIKEALQKL